MERKTMSKDNKLSLFIIVMFFLFLLLMGTSSCSRPNSARQDAIMFNKGKQAAHSEYVGLVAYLVTFNAVVDGATVCGSEVFLAANDTLALSCYRSQVIETLGFDKIESLSFSATEYNAQWVLNPAVEFSMSLRE